MAKKIAGLTYVKDFEFPAEQGFTGSAGKESVRGYYRGGRVKKDPVKAAAQKKRAAGPGAAKGGKVAYAYGGGVKTTSKEFVQKRSKQDTMDSGVFPAQSTTAADKEAGGRPKLKPKFAEGGRYRGRPDKVTGRKSRKARAPRRGQQSSTDRREGGEDTGRRSGGEDTARRRASGRGMPKNVKAQGGLAQYHEGGYVAPPTSAVPGTGQAQRAADAMVRQNRRTRTTIDAALRGAQSAMGIKKTPPATPRKPRNTKGKR